MRSTNSQKGTPCLSEYFVAITHLTTMLLQWQKTPFEQPEGYNPSQSGALKIYTDLVVHNRKAPALGVV